MKRPHIDEHSLVRVSLGLGRDIDDFDPPLTDSERWWYNTLKAEEAEMKKFAKEHPGIKPICELPFD